MNLPCIYYCPKCIRNKIHVYYRNVLVESARIARGKVEALSVLKQDNFDAVVFPGGFGAAKNL